MEDTSLTVDKIHEDCQKAFQRVKDIRAKENDKDKQGMYDKQIAAVEKGLQELHLSSDDQAKRQVPTPKPAHRLTLSLSV